jgi:hypothetical protein
VLLSGVISQGLGANKVFGSEVWAKPLDDWYKIPLGVEARRLDLSVLANCHGAVRGIDTVYNLAADGT